MKKIAIISPSYPPNIWSGIGRMTHSIAQGLAKRDYEVNVITYKGSSRNKMSKDGDVIVRYVSVSDGQESSSTLGIDSVKAWQEQVKDLLQYQLRNVSTIILIDSYGYMPVVESQEGKEEKAKVIGIANFLYNVYGWLNQRIDSVLQETMLTEERAFIKGVDTLLVNNDPIASKIRMFADRNPDKFKMGVPAIETILANHSHDYKVSQSGQVTFLGKLNRDKGLERVLRAMHDLPWMKLNVIGSPAGPSSGNSYQQYLDNLVSKLDIGRRVTFLGWMKSREAWNHYLNSEIVIVPSINEPFGYAAMDPMSAGIPVIASTANILPEIVCDAEDGLIFQNIDELRYALEELHHMTPIKEAFSVTGREKMAKEYTLDKMVESIIPFID